MYRDEPPYDQDGTPDEFERIQAAYREIQRRDGAAWYHAKNWRRFALVLLAGLLGSVVVNAYLAKQASRVEVLVQTVQLTEEGRSVQVGVPSDLLAYMPSDGEWINMLAQWVMERRLRRGRGERRCEGGSLEGGREEFREVCWSWACNASIMPSKAVTRASKARI